MTDFKKLFESFVTLKTGVIGDIMLDTYIWGNVERISPEAPVPIVSLDHKEYRIGGAGNVALNCHSLGSQVFILSVTGDDTDSLLLEELFNENLIDTSYILKSTRRITTNKTRIISRNQQMMRLDSEETHDLEHADENALLEKISSFIETEDPDIMIFEDYNKGVLTERVIREAIHLCREAGIITSIDPKRKNFFSYQHADIFKPNLKEVKEALNLLVDEVNKPLLEKIHKELERMLHHRVSFITLSEKGVFCQQDGTSSLMPSHRRNIADVSGAGDTVAAVASLVYAATKNIHLMAEVANIAGGLVCEEVGTVAIDRGKLLNECELLLS
ncbi:MAG: carbohydrate kinase [Chitinophagaceae bacterium]|jgi:rfaE bifunctional protein kinase chain/domain|nr:carbohydrate kinase [Chitinophagaceae bacterium]OQY95096.1 MAG: carbohydrate kinase [Sphingobacteriales bacterium UTBCD1]